MASDVELRHGLYEAMVNVNKMVIDDDEREVLLIVILILIFGQVRVVEEQVEGVRISIWFTSAT